MRLYRLPGLLAVCKLDHNAALPDWVDEEDFTALVRTSEELTVVCPQANVPAFVTAEVGWVALKVHGPLEFDMVGVLAELSTTLAKAGVSIFAISTYNTDYILLKESRLDIACSALEEVGHTVLDG